MTEQIPIEEYCERCDNQILEAGFWEGNICQFGLPSIYVYICKKCLDVEEQDLEVEP